MHPVTRIYWTAWLLQIQTTQAQGKVLMHGTYAWYWRMVGRVPEFAHYTHTCLARRKQLVSGKKLHGHVSWIRVHYWLHPCTRFIMSIEIIWDFHCHSMYWCSVQSHSILFYIVSFNAAGSVRLGYKFILIALGFSAVWITKAIWQSFKILPIQCQVYPQDGERLSAAMV